jgi:hypothetical protein
MEAGTMREFLILAVSDGGGRPRLSACPMKRYPLPFGAEIITRVVEPDLDMMLSWTKRQSDRGWDVRRIKAACE